MNVPEEGTRTIALGSAALVQGFALIGFEAYPDADAQTMEQVLSELHRRHDTALVLVEHSLAAEGGHWYQRIRSEGGRIVITEVPSLEDPGSYRPKVEEMVEHILGPNALKEE
jgi:vacuolar-type H+-ATPase subunit F/Vma7